MEEELLMELYSGCSPEQLSAVFKELSLAKLKLAPRSRKEHI